METTIQKWGNSQGLRIPKSLLDAVGLRENDRVELVQAENVIQIRKVVGRQHRSLEERLAAFYGTDPEKLGRISDEPEVDWGEPKGEEVW